MRLYFLISGVFAVFHISACGLVDAKYENYIETGLSDASTPCGAEALELFEVAFSSTISSSCLTCHGPSQSGSAAYLKVALSEDSDENREALFNESKFDGAKLLAAIVASTHPGKLAGQTLAEEAVLAWTAKEEACSNGEE